MEKTTAIVLLVIFALILVLLIRFLFPSIKSYVNHMPKGVFVLLLLLVIAVIIFLVVYLTSDDPSGLPFFGYKKNEQVLTAEQEQEKKLIEEGITVSGNSLFINDERVEIETVSGYIDTCIKEGKEVVIVDDYASSKLYHQVEDLCIQKNVTPKYMKKEK